MLAQDDQLGARDRLVVIEALQNHVGRRTARAALRGKEFNQHGNAGWRCIWRRRLALGLRGLRLQMKHREKGERQRSPCSMSRMHARSLALSEWIVAA